jgi:hypothetical protein
MEGDLKVLTPKSTLMTLFKEDPNQYPIIQTIPAKSNPNCYFVSNSILLVYSHFSLSLSLSNPMKRLAMKPKTKTNYIYTLLKIANLF